MFIVLFSMAIMGTKQTIDSNGDDGFEVRSKNLNFQTSNLIEYLQ